MMNIKTIHSLDTEYSADSVEWCPTENSQEYFVCGTYQLEDNKSEELVLPTRRKGRIYLFKYDAITEELSKLDAIETAAILDQKWTEIDKKPVVAAANALGEIMLYALVSDKLTLTSSVHLNPDIDNLLTLSIDWNANEKNKQLLSSDSKGNISLLQLNESNLNVVTRWNGHSFEAWTCCFDKWNDNIIYSGGDDTSLHVYDTRIHTKTMTNKSHMAGVTSLLSFDNKEHILATGSYDENLRIFDIRAFKNPLSAINLKGGVWRIKPDPVDKNLLLCACMYHNFSIVKLDESNEKTELVGEYFEHKSICYGSDWCRKIISNQMVMATLSLNELATTRRNTCRY
ncbi:Diphthine methyltransferase [Pseudolycoriella hygida]|uniref:methylated diphthine methylhydrolase n=1 Tax=Pseudolycoriella hygida TaxID=35572 RepID=A0A9Q0NE46_9DIPT|nr:Diphthine methyltransferase [Pseudolycoriella hygida]